jgi:HEXXH motif-containing protein
MKKNNFPVFSWKPEQINIIYFNAYFRQHLKNKLLDKIENYEAKHIIEKQIDHPKAFPYFSWANYRDTQFEQLDQLLQMLVANDAFDAQANTLYKSYALGEFARELQKSAGIPVSLSLIQNNSYRKQVTASLSLLRDVNKSFYAEYKNIITEVVLVQGNELISSSHPFIIGTIFLCPKPSWTTSTFAELIVHETSHQVLDLLTSLDPLIENGDSLGASPLRNDKRPLIAILHAIFVLRRLMHFYECLGNQQPLTEDEATLYHNYCNDFEEGVSTLQSLACWTQRGKVLFDSLAKSIVSIL